jgi:hypothetical protein
MTHKETRTAGSSRLPVNVVKALGDLAYGDKRMALRKAINRLCEGASRPEDRYLAHCSPRGGELLEARAEARRLLDFAARVGEKLHKGKMNESEARTVLQNRADLAGERGRVDTPFVVREVIAHGRRVFKPIGPKDPSAPFLVAYSFWTAVNAPRSPEKAVDAFEIPRWRTFLLRRCMDCKCTYRDGRIEMRGGVKNCPTCGWNDRKEKDTRVARDRDPLTGLGQAQGFRRIKKESPK